MILSIDPGKRQVGFALWHPGTNELFRAGLITTACPYDDDLLVCMITATAVLRYLDGTAVITEYVAERPRIYPLSKQVKNGRRTDPNDLPPLMGVSVAIGAGLMLRACGEKFMAQSYLPREWKGTLDKRTMNARAWSRLTPAEQDRVTMKKDHNVLDALGIGLKYLRRLEPVRVYAR